MSRARIVHGIQIDIQTPHYYDDKPATILLHKLGTEFREWFTIPELENFIRELQDARDEVARER